ncbi:hypothetical protein Tco_0767070 [Tanacetum coccineum]
MAASGGGSEGGDKVEMVARVMMLLVAAVWCGCGGWYEGGGGDRGGRGGDVRSALMSCGRRSMAGVGQNLAGATPENGRVCVWEARSDRLVDEADEEPQPTPEIPMDDDEYNLHRGIQMSLESFQAPVDGVAIREPASGVTRSLPVAEGKGKGIATDEQAAQSLIELQ